MKRAFAVLSVLVLTATLSGCIGAFGQWLQGPTRLTGHWIGTITHETASTPACIDVMLPLELMVIEFDDGAITGTGFRMACDPTDFEKGAYIHGSHNGDEIRLRYHEFDTSTPQTLVGTLQGNTISGTFVSINQSGTLKASGTWEVSKVE